MMIMLFYYKAYKVAGKLAKGNLRTGAQRTLAGYAKNPEADPIINLSWFILEEILAMIRRKIS